MRPAVHAKETLSTAGAGELPSLEPYIDSFTLDHDANVVVTNAEGLVVATNDPDVRLGSDYSNRPEIAVALGGRPAVGERASISLGEPLLFVAVPVLLGDSSLGSVRLSEPRSEIDDVVRSRIIGIVTAGLITLLAAGAAAVPFALVIARPIDRLRRGTERLAEGDFVARVDARSGPPEVRALASAFNAMAARLGATVEGQRQFAGLVSHQLRTPLTALRLRLEQAQEVAVDDVAISADLEAIRAEVDRLQEMIEQLLVLSRIEGSGAPAIVVDAAGIARQRVEMWESFAAENGAALVVGAPPTARCMCVEGGLEQILDNYIDNAISYAPEGTHVRVAVAVDGGSVVVEVCDEGPGMSETDRARAFERFWRGSDASRRGGTGLGLAIARQIAVTSGGEVSLRPGVPAGTVARVSLRRA
ncbi:MAG: sensor histidine kinase [Actinomycetota bacterium]